MHTYICVCVYMYIQTQFQIMINTIKSQAINWVKGLLLSAGWSGECSLRTLHLNRGQRKQKRERERLEGENSQQKNHGSKRSEGVREQGGSHGSRTVELVWGKACCKSWSTWLGLETVVRNLGLILRLRGAHDLIYLSTSSWPLWRMWMEGTG